MRVCKVWKWVCSLYCVMWAIKKWKWVCTLYKVGQLLVSQYGADVLLLIYPGFGQKHFNKCNTLQGVPILQGSAPYFREVPHTSGKVPHTSGKVQHTSGKVPHTSGKVPHTSGKVPHTSGKVPHTSNNYFKQPL